MRVEAWPNVLLGSNPTEILGLASIDNPLFSPTLAIDLPKKVDPRGETINVELTFETYSISMKVFPCKVLKELRRFTAPFFKHLHKFELMGSDPSTSPLKLEFLFIFHVV